MCDVLMHVGIRGKKASFETEHWIWKKNKNKNKTGFLYQLLRHMQGYHLMLLDFSLFFVYEKGMRQDHTESQSWAGGSVRYWIWVKC